MPATMMPLASPREITVNVVDSQNAPINGADISFGVNGTPLGSVWRSLGKATIVMPDPFVVVEARATVMLVTQTAQLPPGQNTHTFRFSQAPPPKKLAPPEAQCPDGSSGQPCVDCQVGGSTVRVCV